MTHAAIVDSRNDMLFVVMNIQKPLVLSYTLIPEFSPFAMKNGGMKTTINKKNAIATEQKRRPCRISTNLLDSAWSSEQLSARVLARWHGLQEASESFKHPTMKGRLNCIQDKINKITEAAKEQDAGCMNLLTNMNS